MPPKIQPKAKTVKIQVKAFAGDNTENIVEETVMESAHVVTPVVVNHPQTRRIEVKPFVHQHRSTKCAYNITQMDSKQPKTVKIQVKAYGAQHEAPRPIHLMDFDELEEMILRSYEEKNPETEMSLEPVDKVTSVKDNSGKEVIFEPVDKVNSWDLDEAPRPIHLMEFDELEEMILRSYEEKNPVKEMSLEPVDKVTSVKDTSGKEVIFEPVDEVNSWDLDEAPCAIHLMDFDKKEEKILLFYKKANPAKDNSIKEIISKPVDKVTTVKDNSVKEIISKPVDKVTSVKDNVVKEMSLEPVDKVTSVKDNSIKEMSSEPLHKVTSVKNNLVKEICLETVDKVTLVEVKQTENTVEQRAANPSGSCNPIKSTRENKTPLQSFVTLLTVRVMTKLHLLHGKNEERFVKHAEQVVNQTLEGLNIPEDFCPDIKFIDRMCKAVTRDLKKDPGKEMLRALILMDSSSADEALVKALQKHITKAFDKLSKKEDSRSWRKRILHVASVIRNFLHI
ncbi:uncharacterized protein LOC121913375 isoform X2 [Scomber scombrus]|uniref:Uncharacterized protein LOC121913375 isoform X2 n=1 Tax=Scomber scombrus TaxID=13677 RepID=A0AAV1Q263_SCOSC